MACWFGSVKPLYILLLAYPMPPSNAKIILLIELLETERPYNVRSHQELLHIINAMVEATSILQVKKSFARLPATMLRLKPLVN